MMRFAWWAPVLAITLCCCSAKTADTPIDIKKMAQIVADVHVAEAALQNYNTTLRDSLMQVYYEQIFYIHKISQEDFIKTMDQIKQDPANIEALYKEVLEEIDAREAALR